MFGCNEHRHQVENNGSVKSQKYFPCKTGRKSTKCIKSPEKLHEVTKSKQMYTVKGAAKKVMKDWLALGVIKECSYSSKCQIQACAYILTEVKKGMTTLHMSLIKLDTYLPVIISMSLANRSVPIITKTCLFKYT